MHSLLMRQLKKAFGRSDGIAPEWQEFLASVDEAYRQNDTDRLMLERALDLSSEELREAGSEMRAILQTLPDIFFRIDPAGKILDSKGPAVPDPVFSNVKMTGKYLQDSFPPALHDPFLDMLAETLATRSMTSLVCDVRLNEKLHYYEARCVPFLNDQAIVVMRNITERKEAEDSLRQSEEKYKLLVENANMAIIIAQDFQIKYANPKTSELIGYSNEELLGMPGSSYAHPDDLPLFLQVHEKRMRGEPVPYSYTARVVHKNGHTLWGEFTGVSITWEGRPATMNFVKDVTQQKKLEEQLLQAQKLEAIGTLAGGIAHDFNNLLMGIQGYASLMLLDMDSSHPFHTKLKSIEQQVKSGANLTKQLLGFARGGKYEVRATNLNELILHNSELFGRTKKEIIIHRYFAKDLWTVEIDRGQIDQVLLNIYINAWQAMPGRGSLYLETQNVDLAEDGIKAYDIPPGRYVKISIRDTGMGMDEATRRRIFDPFFTTKEMGRGVGLGLASAYGIICNHGGIITVDSEKGKGTTFNIFLPATESREEGEAPPASAIQGGHETILIVDDEDINIEVMGAMAKKLGYQVLTARSGQEAVKLYRLDHGAIDLVILDAIMPGLNGSDTFEILKGVNPRVKVILASGYSMDHLASRILERGVRAFIQKPFRIEDIAEKIKTVLAEKN